MKSFAKKMRQSRDINRDFWLIRNRSCHPNNDVFFSIDDDAKLSFWGEWGHRLVTVRFHTGYDI
jgi:hypothetical protein